MSSPHRGFSSAIIRAFLDPARFPARLSLEGKTTPVSPRPTPAVASLPSQLDCPEHASQHHGSKKRAGGHVYG